MKETTVTTERFQVPGVSCQHCVNAITKEVSALPGVQRVQVALDDKTVTVEHGEQVNTDQIVAAINEAGYDEVARLS
jgi:copper ion binding protein